MCFEVLRKQISSQETLDGLQRGGYGTMLKPSHMVAPSSMKVQVIGTESATECLLWVYGCSCGANI